MSCSSEVHGGKIAERDALFAVFFSDLNLKTIFWASWPYHGWALARSRKYVYNRFFNSLTKKKKKQKTKKYMLIEYSELIQVKKKIKLIRNSS
jgi:hypothetical protein